MLTRIDKVVVLISAL